MTTVLPREELGWTTGAAGTAAGCCALAGTIHLMVAVPHLAEAWWLGVAFAGLGLAQLLLAVLVSRPQPVRVLLVAIGGTAGVIALYVASRTTDLWFMPAHGVGHEIDHLPVAGGIGNGIPIYPGDRIEPVGPLDLTCLGAELVLLAILLAFLPARIRARIGSGLTVLTLVAVTTYVWR